MKINVEIRKHGKIEQANSMELTGAQTFLFASALQSIDYAKEAAYEIDGAWMVTVEDGANGARFYSDGDKVVASFTQASDYSYQIEVTGHEDEYLDSFIYC